MKEPQFVSVDTSKLESKLADDKPFRGNRTPTLWIQFKDGDEFEVRILPPWSTEGDYAFLPYMKIFQHWDVGPGSKRVICPHQMSDKSDPCYICEQVNALYKTGDKADSKQARRMRAGQSFIYQVIDRADPVWLETDDGVKDNPEVVGRPKIKLMRLPYAGHSQLLGYYNDPDYGDISHHMEGLDIKVKRTGTGLDTEYGVKTKRNNTPMFGEVDDPDLETMTMVLEDMYKIDEHPFFRVASYDETCSIFLGEDDDNDSSGSAAVASSRKSGLLPPKRDAFADWVENAQKTWMDGKAGVPRTVEEVAEAYGVGVSQISDCYSATTNHEVQGCLDCPINVPCACTFYSKFGRWSESAPEEAPVAKAAGGIIGRPVSSAAPASMNVTPDDTPAVSSVEQDNDVAAMMEFLESDEQ